MSKYFDYMIAFERLVVPGLTDFDLAGVFVVPVFSEERSFND